MNENRRKYDSEKEYLIHILGCILNRRKPDEMPEHLDFQKLYDLASYHKLEHMVFYGIEQLENPPGQKLYQEWEESRDKAIVRDLQQAEEITKIYRSFSEAGIKMIFLKGSILKEIYPSPDMRFMGDIDVLIPTEAMEKADEIMKRRGFQLEGESELEIVYHKKPLLNVEVHRKLVQKETPYYAFSKAIWERAREVDGQPFMYEFLWEDFYLYQLIHLKRHFDGGGTGIRYVMDIYLFLQKWRETLDWEQLHRTAKELGIETFMEDLEQLADTWFGKGIWAETEEQRELAEYVITSGLYGVKSRYIENQVQSALKKGKTSLGGKAKYFLGRCFLPYDTMIYMYPSLRKCPILLPFCWIHRLVRAVFTKKTIVKMELKAMKEMKKE